MSFSFSAASATATLKVEQGCALSAMDSLSCEQNLHFCRETHRSHAATNGRIVTFLFSGVERIVRELLLKCNPFRTRILTTLFRCSSSGQRCWKQWSVVSSQDIM